MYKKRFTNMNCSIARALDEVGEWWTLLIVRECTQGTTRFDEFQTELGIARNVLTDRLQRLIELGILEKFPLTTRVNTDGYRLTAKGEELYPVLVSLMQWGDRWLAPDGNPPTALLDDESGRPLQKIAVKNSVGKDITFREVRFARGPGATSSTDKVIERRNQRVLQHDN